MRQRCESTQSMSPALKMRSRSSTDPTTNLTFSIRALSTLRRACAMRVSATSSPNMRLTCRAYLTVCAASPQPISKTVLLGCRYRARHSSSSDPRIGSRLVPVTFSAADNCSPTLRQCSRIDTRSIAIVFLTSRSPDKCPEPPFKAQERPDEESVVLAPAGVLIKLPGDVSGAHVLVDASLWIP